MASLSTRKSTGTRTIQFVDPEGVRKTVRLGRMAKRAAESVKTRVEDLLAAQVTNTAIDRDTAIWVAGLPEDLREKLHRVGLIEQDQREAIPTLAAWLEQYIGGKSDLKESTLLNYEKNRADMTAFFGADTNIDQITKLDAERFRAWLGTSRGLAEATIRRRCKRAKQILEGAVKARILQDNPFAEMRLGHSVNRARMHFVTRQDAEAFLDACPDATWRAIFALARFGGLRCPSEILRLRWADIDFDKGRLHVHSPKTERHDGGVRFVPMFPELRGPLLDLFTLADEGQEHVIARYRDAKQNLRTQFKRIMLRAGLKPWPRLFANLRASRATELANEFPTHVVTQWLGHTEAVANRHYLQTTDEHFRRAVGEAGEKALQKALQHSDTLASQEAAKGIHGHGKTLNCEGKQKGASPCENKNLHHLTPRRLELRLPG
ncbi:MAG: tyrosine-type recombinase/integrase [Phycisphaerae bacterium]